MKTEKPNNDNPPRVYLSVSDGMYRVISQGLPISKDFPYKTMALEPANRMRLDVSEWAWMGTDGVWIPSSYV